MNTRHGIKLCLLVTATLALISCTFGPKHTQPGSRNVEGLLLEAGFVRNPADTPEKKARIREEVQRKVIPVEEGSQVYYIYADADYCSCLYVGDETAFRRFEGLVQMENLQRNSCIDERLRRTQAEPWREFGELGELCRERP